MTRNAKSPPRLQFHERSCYTCRYYRQHESTTECLLLGRGLGCDTGHYADRARFCEGWKRRPKTWAIRADKNPYFDDAYISRKTQLRLRKRLGIR